SWPGNVRELRNVIERAMILERGNRLGPDALVLDRVEPTVGPAQEPALAPARVGAARPRSASPIAPLEQVERDLVARAMEATGGNQTRAAELLGITRDQLRYRLQKHRLHAADKD
ncbi:MAG: sigma-54-dependent Fis family transcriptional regulator, partial [Acidobacteriota bacterium]